MGGLISTKVAAECDAKLCTIYVVVQPGDKSKSVTCPVCHETLQNEFLEGDEEWVWNNAVQVKDKVCACLSCVHTRHNDEDGLILREKKML